VSQENLERVRAGFEAFYQTGELPDRFLAPDFELHQAWSVVGATGVFHGPNAVRDSLVEVEVALEDLSFAPEKFVEAPNGEIVVFVHVQGRGRGSGIDVGNHIAHVWTLRGDQALRCVVYEDPAEALKAVGLEE
jgi:ketosteroid isomerase-like protein